MSTPSFPIEVAELVARFAEQAEHYRATYNETQVRVDFIDPLFVALGWDVRNEKGNAEAYRDVVHEDKVRVEKETKAPDYAFRIGGTRKFFLEAKKPGVSLKGDPKPAYQLRRYAWSAKLPLSILTDFEELAVYDTRVKPAVGDRASVARVFYCTYDEYEQRWPDLWERFSHEAVRKGRFDAYAEGTKKKRGTAEVDQAFLEEIEGWRRTLAANLRLRNPSLTTADLNYAVQQTIDRIIFLRICEDRGIEPYGLLRDAAKGKDVYAELLKRFRRADERYNSGLFHFSDEPGRREAPDTLTPSLKIDDAKLKPILANLYYPQSPYEFSQIPADLLGQVYEQFLGKVIVPKGVTQIEVVEKPEVRKAGGVYYTPTYVVDYIVGHTLGRLLEGKTPRQAAGLRVLDPACGSGSFLLGAYDHLLKWHLGQYAADPDASRRGKSPKIYEVPGGWRLTTAEKKRILLANVFGVDIDPQAVEVTKLSLLLKVLEGETAQSIDAALSLFHGERALPDLSANIKCGNSLIGPDFYDSAAAADLDAEARYKVNAFAWADEFPYAVKAGGFDAVIGNPPYLSFSGRQAVEMTPEVADYYHSHFHTEGWHTAHGLFMQQAARLTRRCVAYIVPDQVGHLADYGGLRALIRSKLPLVRVRYWGEKVFKGVITPALTFVADSDHDGATEITSALGVVQDQSLASGDEWVASSPHRQLLDKLDAQSQAADAAFADPGVHTGNCSKKLILSGDDDSAATAPVLEGKQVDRYLCRMPTKFLRLDYEPSVDEYFNIRPVAKYTNAPFVVRQTASHPIVGPRENADYFRNSLLALYPPDDGRDVRFLVALLNSKLIRFAYKSAVQESNQKAFPQVKVRSLRALPLRGIDFDNDAERAAHDMLTRVATEMLSLCNPSTELKNPHQAEVHARRVRALDRRIDRLVYDLYGLTEAEVATVEAATAGGE